VVNVTLRHEMATAAARVMKSDESVITEAAAEKYDRALAAVQKLLLVRDVRSFVVHTIDLKLSVDGRPAPLGEVRRHSPELIVHDDAGWMVATVSMGPRSGSYLVSIPNGPGLQTVGSEYPEKAANLILATHPRGRT
jgi:hypothetical protein